MAFTPNPNSDRTGAAADDQAVLVITEGLVFRNIDKIKKVARSYANVTAPAYVEQRQHMYMAMVFDVLAELSKEN